MGWWDVLAAPSTYSVNMNRNETLDMTDQYAPEQGPHREHLVPVVNNDTGLGALHNRGCSWGLNPPASSRLRAM